MEDRFSVIRKSLISSIRAKYRKFIVAENQISCY